MVDWKPEVGCEILQEAIEKKTQDEVMSACAGCTNPYCPVMMAACDIIVKFKGGIWKKLAEGEPGTLMGLSVKDTLSE